jgi:two-component system nitrate/nitrite response regulator NarP
MKVFIADNEKKVRYAIRLLIEQNPQFHICAEAANSQELLSYLNFSKPDMLLLDQHLNGTRLSPTSLETIRKAVPGIKIILMVLGKRDEALIQAADGVISKYSSPETVINTVSAFFHKTEPLAMAHTTIHCMH